MGRGGGRGGTYSFFVTRSTAFARASDVSDAARDANSRRGTRSAAAFSSTVCRDVRGARATTVTSRTGGDVMREIMRDACAANAMRFDD